ncbi:MAG: sulfite exporter TauE/SafE family protein [Melioribacteraceae bacterium]|nr:sulfite exporter TauE/SafE family protein [Melioribacteraceae bacterium]MCF8265451.1 sulfite exporter TauE/SafE family protein [Melioribacteraceae bacterium]MCF8431391.1 sulfite exporter TauE/SafE family protein [Melioribacteraceae bacterium]
MDQSLGILLLTALSIGFIHTILGPDHYIPFIAMAKAGEWSKIKTVIVTVLAGIGHVMSSILLGFIGIALGLALNILEDIESMRGDFAGWALITFGLIYFIWGLRRAFKNKKHSHWHKHPEGVVHDHEHSHKSEHAHVHEESASSKITPWVLFTIFVFGPCEALIPLLMYPAANSGIFEVVLVSTVFGVSTILTMLTIVMVALYGFQFVPIEKFNKYSHAAAGLLILISGLSVQVLGL